MFIYVISEYFFRISTRNKVIAKNLIFDILYAIFTTIYSYLNFQLKCIAKHWIIAQAIELWCLRECIHKPSKDNGQSRSIKLKNNVLLLMKNLLVLKIFKFWYLN